MSGPPRLARGATSSRPRPSPARRCQPAQHDAGVRRVALGQRQRDRRNGALPRRLGLHPRAVGIDRTVVLADREHEVARVTGLQLERHRERTIGIRLGLLATGPAERASLVRPRQTPSSQAHAARGLTAIVAGQRAHDLDLRLPADHVESPEDHRAVARGREHQRLAALDDSRDGHPAAAPDQRARLVAPAPDMPLARGDRIHPAAADHRSEHGWVRPARKAHPRDVPTRSDQRPALSIGQQRVLAQHVWRCLQRAVHVDMSIPTEPVPEPEARESCFGRRRTGRSRFGTSRPRSSRTDDRLGEPVWGPRAAD